MGKASLFLLTILICFSLIIAPTFFAPALSAEAGKSTGEAVSGSFIATWNDYVRRELKYESDLSYKVLSMKANEMWNWQSGTDGMGYVNVAMTLQKAMNENRFLKVFIASGFYDLDTSYFATKYTVDNLNLVPGLNGNITLAFYDAGHQMYTSRASLIKLKSDVVSFFKRGLQSQK